MSNYMSNALSLVDPLTKPIRCICVSNVEGNRVHKHKKN